MDEERRAADLDLSDDISDDLSDEERFLTHLSFAADAFSITSSDIGLNIIETALYDTLIECDLSSREGFEKMEETIAKQAEERFSAKNFIYKPVFEDYSFTILD